MCGKSTSTPFALSVCEPAGTAVGKSAFRSSQMSPDRGLAVWIALCCEDVRRDLGQVA